MRHKFSKEEASRGGKSRSQMESFKQHQSDAFEILKAKRPDCWRWIYKHRVKPHMNKKGLEN